MKSANICLAICLASSATNAQAPYDWVVPDAHVISIEITYMPDRVMFSTDKTAGACSQGTYLTWTGQGSDASAKASNAKSALAALMSAKMTGTMIQMYGVNANCQVKFLYFG